MGERHSFLDDKEVIVEASCYVLCVNRRKEWYSAKEIGVAVVAMVDVRARCIRRYARTASASARFPSSQAPADRFIARTVSPSGNQPVNHVVGGCV